MKYHEINSQKRLSNVKLKHDELKCEKRTTKISFHNALKYDITQCVEVSHQNAISLSSQPASDAIINNFPVILNRITWFLRPEMRMHKLEYIQNQSFRFYIYIASCSFRDENAFMEQKINCSYIMSWNMAQWISHHKYYIFG